jgi:hypothetical protein
MLRRLLRGRHIPVLGGNATPAEIIGRTIEQSPDPRSFSNRMARLLASLLSRDMVAIVAAGPQLDPEQRAALINALRLAAALPANEYLAPALRDLLVSFRKADARIFGDEPFVFRHALWRALARQQVDSSLKSEWLNLLGNRATWTPELRTLLLEAWRGLLLIPPDPTADWEAPVLDFDRLELGLTALCQTAGGQEGGLALIRYALEMLAQTYPRSGEFWVAHLGSRAHHWPAELRKEAEAKWPEISLSSAV